MENRLKDIVQIDGVLNKFSRVCIGPCFVLLSDQLPSNKMFSSSRQMLRQPYFIHYVCWHQIKCFYFLLNWTIICWVMSAHIPQIYYPQIFWKNFLIVYFYFLKDIVFNVYEETLSLISKQDHIEKWIISGMS